MRSTDADGLPLRHARVWLDPSAWRAALAGPLDATRLDALTGWIAAGRAVVATRRLPGDVDACGCGVALPLAADRVRIGFAVHRRAIARVAAPLALVEAMDAAPAAWRDALHDLDVCGRRHDTVFHVYGSLAWQALAGEACVLPTSDIDLLWTARSVAQIERVLDVLADWEADSGLRADGELVLPDDGAVAWRELRAGADRVLVKHRDGVSLRPAPAWWRAQYADGAMAAA